VLDAAGREPGVLEVNREPLDKVGDHVGDGGVVFGGEKAGLAVEVEGNDDGDVFELAHGWVSPRPGVGLNCFDYGGRSGCFRQSEVVADVGVRLERD